MQRYGMVQIFERQAAEKFNESALFAFGEAIEVHKDGPWVAGGAVRRTLAGMPMDSDYDCFANNAGQRDDIRLTLSLSQGTKVQENDFCETWKVSLGHDKLKNIVVQIIKRDYANIEQVLDSFDFTICQMGYDGHDLVCSDYALWDLGRRRLVPAKITYGVASVRRLIKYTRQGFRVCEGGIADILEQVVNDPSIINSRTQYID